MREGAGFSDQWRREEKAERERLRQLEGRLDALKAQRRELLGQVRSLSSKQQALYDRGRAPQTEAERLYHEYGELGHRLAELRRAIQKAREDLENAVIRRRELVLTFERGERLNPEQVRREIAELELRQQTRALSLDEENALITELRRKVHVLKEFEQRKELVAQHEVQRREAEGQIVAARTEIDRLVKEMEVIRAERDKRKVEIPTTLEAAGAAVAELRETGRNRSELMTHVDTLSREIAEIEREGRALLEKYRQRQEIAREILREYSRPVNAPESSE